MSARLAGVAWLCVAACGRIGFDARAGDANGDARDSAFTPVAMPAGAVGRRVFEGPGGEIYLAGEIDRTWRSDDGGATWSECARLRVYATAHDGTQLYVAGVELVGQARGGDVFTSTDGCATWTATGAIPSDQTPRALVHANGRVIVGALGLRERVGGTWRMLASPADAVQVQSLATDGAAILAGTTTPEILRSTDDGMTWAPATGTPLGEVEHITFASETPGRAYVISGDGAARSIDGGATWFPISGTGGVSIAASPADADYILLGLYADLMLSTTAGGGQATARTAVLAASVPQQILFTSDRVWVATERGVFDSAYPALDWQPRHGALDASTIAAFAISADGSTRYAASFYGVLRSTDGGATYSLSTNGLSPGAKTFSVATVDGDSDRVFAAGRRVWMSTDRGLTFSPVFTAGLADRYNVLVLAASGTRIWAGSYDRLLTSDPPWSSWTPHTIAGAAREVSDIAPVDMLHAFVATTSGLFETMDGGVSWMQIGSFGNGRPQKLDIAADGSLWIAASNGMWSYRAGDFGRRGLDGLSVSDVAVRGDLIVASLAARGVQYSRDGGATWTVLPGLEDRWARRVTVEPEGTVLVGTNGFGLQRAAVP